jgi:uncharacterized protein (TIRG00374 family)
MSVAASSRRTLWLQRGLALLALGVALYLFWPLLGELRAAARVFLTARWEWFPLVLAIQVVSYALLAWLNELALRPFAGRSPGLGRMAALLTSMAFIEVAIPSAGASGVVLRARLLGKYGYSPEASLFSLGVETFFLGLIWSGVALVGIGYLLSDGALQGWQVALLFLLALTAALLLWGAWRLLEDPQRSHALLLRAVRFWNRRVFRPLPLLDENKIASRLEQFLSEVTQLRRVPLWKFLAAASGRVLLDIATLGACFLFFGEPLPASALLIGYSLILTASALAALPGGLGLADLSIPGLFLKLGVQGAVALSAALTYRLVAFWLIRFVGFLAWQFLESRP